MRFRGCEIQLIKVVLTVQILLVCWPTTSMAILLMEMPQGLNFIHQETPTGEWRGIQAKVEKLAIEIGLRASPGFAQYMGMDFIAASDDGQKFMVLLAGAKVNSQYRNKLFNNKNTWIFYTDVRGQPMMLAFHGLNTKAVESFLRAATRSEQASHGGFYYWIASHLLGATTCAADTIVKPDSPASSSLAPSKESSAMKCYRNFGQGGWDVLEFPWHAFQDVAVKPILGNIAHIREKGWARYWEANKNDFWNRLTALETHWQNFKSALANPAATITDMKAIWAQLSEAAPPGHHLEAFCRSTGSGVASLGLMPVYAKIGETAFKASNAILKKSKSFDRNIEAAPYTSETPTLAARGDVKGLKAQDTSPESYTQLENLGGKRPIIEKSIRDNAPFAGPNSKVVIVRDPDTSETLGFFQYKTEGDSKLIIEFVNVSEKVQSSGLSKAMFAQVLKDNPGIKEVHTTIAGTNEKIVRAKMVQGRSCLESLLSSPAAKMRLRFGFDKVVSFLWDPQADDGVGKYELVQAR